MNVTITQGQETLLVAGLPPKDFATGAQGFFVAQKLTLGNVAYQCQIQLVRIGSNTEAEAPARAAKVAAYKTAKAKPTTLKSKVQRPVNG